MVLERAASEENKPPGDGRRPPRRASPTTAGPIRNPADEISLRDATTPAHRAFPHHLHPELPDVGALGWVVARRDAVINARRIRRTTFTSDSVEIV